MIAISSSQQCKAWIWYNFLIHGWQILLVAFGFKFLNNDQIPSWLNVGFVEEVQIQVDNEIVLSFDLHELPSKIEIHSFILWQINYFYVLIVVLFMTQFTCEAQKYITLITSMICSSSWHCDKKSCNLLLEILNNNYLCCVK